MDLADLVSPRAMKRAARGWWLVLGAVVACRRSAPATETTTVSDPPPAQTASARPPGCDAPREGESLAEFDTRCRGGLQAAGSDCDVPKEDESFDAFQQRCARRARARAGERPTMPTAPMVPGVSDAGVTVAATDAPARDFTASLTFRGSPTPESSDVLVLDRLKDRLEGDITACAVRSAARHEYVPGVLLVQYSVAGRRFTSTRPAGTASPFFLGCMATAFRSVELTSALNGSGTLLLMLREQ